jgi:hypothetical protein
MTFEESDGTIHRFQFGQNYHDRVSGKFVVIKFGIAHVSPFQASIEIYENGTIRHRDTVCLSYDVSYAHIDDVVTVHNPTPQQVDAVMELIRSGKFVREGWDCLFNEGTTVQRWLQRTEYGNLAIRQHYEGVPLA